MTIKIDATLVTNPVSPAGFQDVALTTTATEARIDSRILATSLGNHHKNIRELVEQHKADFAELGVLRFETAKPAGDQGGRPEKFVLLNEDQTYLLLTYTRNTKRTRQLKVKLVKAFSEARRAACQHSTEYLPAYHQLHDEIHALAAGSSHERHVHMNVNRLINKTVGVKAGQRALAGVPTQALMIVAQTVAAQAMHSAHNHHDGYQRVKQSMQALFSLSLKGGRQ